MNIKRVLITGADGFIGSHLTEALLEKGYKIKALSYYNSFNYWGWIEDIPRNKNLEVVSGDIRDPHFSKEVVKGRRIFWKPIGLGGNVNPILRVISKYFERIIFLFIELVFLIFPLMYILSQKMSDIFRTMNKIAITFLFSSYIIVLLISIGQALVIAPEPRLSVPTDPIIIIVSLFLIYEFKHKYVIKNN